jgi:hypothetical protein
MSEDLMDYDPEDFPERALVNDWFPDGEYEEGVLGGFEDTWVLVMIQYSRASRNIRSAAEPLTRDTYRGAVPAAHNDLAFSVKEQLPNALQVPMIDALPLVGVDIPGDLEFPQADMATVVPDMSYYLRFVQGEVTSAAKIFEILFQMDLRPQGGPLRIACLAEGRGGILEYLASHFPGSTLLFNTLETEITARGTPSIAYSRDVDRGRIIMNIQDQGYTDLSNELTIQMIAEHFDNVALVTMDAETGPSHTLNQKIYWHTVWYYLTKRTFNGLLIMKVFGRNFSAWAGPLTLLSNKCRRVHLFRCSASRPNSELYIVAQGSQGTIDHGVRGITSSPISAVVVASVSEYLRGLLEQQISLRSPTITQTGAWAARIDRTIKSWAQWNGDLPYRFHARLRSILGVTTHFADLDDQAIERDIFDLRNSTSLAFETAMRSEDMRMGDRTLRTASQLLRMDLLCRGLAASIRSSQRVHWAVTWMNKVRMIKQYQEAIRRMADGGILQPFHPDTVDIAEGSDLYTAGTEPGELRYYRYYLEGYNWGKALCGYKLYLVALRDARRENH